MLLHDPSRYSSWSGAELARSLAGRWDVPAPPAIEASVRRALAALQAQGLVAKDADGTWYSPEARREAEEKSRRRQQNGPRNRRQRERRARDKTQYEREAQDQLRQMLLECERHSPTRVLVKMLGMLGSEHDGEILAAAKAAEAERRRLGKTWAELLG